MTKEEALTMLEMAAEPLEIFNRWLADAEQSEPNDPNAAALATATPDGAPSVRMVLVKRSDARGFCFYSNAESQKGGELEANPRAALCLHWKTQRRQVRVSGPVHLLTDAETNEYFHSRGHRSQVGSAVSQQSRPLENREELHQAVEAFDKAHPEKEVPRPDYWKGYRVEADRIEFWLDGPDRLHDRMVFTKSGEGWGKQRLWP